MESRSIVTRLTVHETREAMGRPYDMWYGIKARKEAEADLQRRRETSAISPHEGARPLFWGPLECDRGYDLGS